MKSLINKIYRRVVPLFYGTGLGNIKIIQKANFELRAIVKPETVKFYGNTMFLDKYDMNQLSVLGQEGKDYHEISFIRDKIGKGDKVLDVGANIGTYTVLLSNWVGSTGTVYSFEPSKDNCEIIKKTLKINNMENVKLIEKAVTNFNGQSNLDVGVDCTGYYITRDIVSKSSIVQCVKLDDIFKNNEKIDFMKLDAEGQELNVLKGMHELLKQPQLKIMMEFEPETHSKENDPEKTLDLLESYGYTFTDIGRNGVIKKIMKEELLLRKDKNPSLYKNIYCEKTI
jgi:FkbM family methyltransferase